MDVLRYSAVQAEAYLTDQCIQKAACIPTRTTCLANSNTCLSTLCSQTTVLQATLSSAGPEAACWTQVIEPCLLRTPQATSLWACIPTGSGWTGGVRACRCAGNPQFNYGSCCAWTVPPGVTCARFQIWGAGGGSAAGACCSISPFGSTGAYASVIIPVTAGQIYTLCAGCALACYPCRFVGGRFPGCPSFVTGTGLTNFCAQGGQGRMGVWMQMYGKRCAFRFSSIFNESAGSCLCSNGSYVCFINSCATCGEIPYVAGASYYGSTTNNSIVYGIRGMWPVTCYDTALCGYTIHPPIYGSESTTQCCLPFNSGTCCGRVRSACCAYLQVPGAGGAPSISRTTNYGHCGDMGRGGMVCVCFK